MHPILSAVGSVASLRFRSRASLELEIIALRHQVGVLQRLRKRIIRVPLLDRFFWVWLYRIWPRALDVIVMVRPKTVIKWHYAGFRMFWRRSHHKPWNKIGLELRDLIHQMKRDNPLWGVRRIEGELRKLGFDISYMTVSRYLRRQVSSPSPGWRVFLQNHMKDTAAVDMLVVVTLTFQLLYAMILISHGRRKILHLDVTEHPTQDWMAAQITRAFSSNPKPKFLLRDRDAIYGGKFRARLKKLGIEERLTTPMSPWQNAYVERVIGSIRRECLDHVIVLNKRHLKRLLSSYMRYYNFSRTHRALDLDCPVQRPVDPPSKGKKIVAIPKVGGLHHRYERRAA